MRTQVAAAVALGYFLGRTKKMKLAITIGGVLAGRRFGTDPQQLLRQGAKVLSSSPGLSSVTETVRGRLADAAKEAATAALSGRIDSLGDSLTERAAKLRGTGGGESGEESGRRESDPTSSAAESATDSGTERPRARSSRPRPEQAARSRAQDRPRPEQAPRSPSEARPRSRRGGDDG